MRNYKSFTEFAKRWGYHRYSEIDSIKEGFYFFECNHGEGDFAILFPIGPNKAIEMCNWIATLEELGRTDEQEIITLVDEMYSGSSEYAVLYLDPGHDTFALCDPLIIQHIVSLTAESRRITKQIQENYDAGSHQKVFTDDGTEVLYDDADAECNF